MVEGLKKKREMAEASSRPEIGVSWIYADGREDYGACGGVRLRL